MAFKFGYSTLRWQTPDLEPLLVQLKEAGWDGWEMRQSLEWVGTPGRVRRICENVGLPVVVVTAQGLPIDKDREQMELNKRRIDFAAEVGADCFMFMGAAKPTDHDAGYDHIAALADVSEDWAEYAAQFGLEVCYHIHTNTTVDSIEDWAKYMSLLRQCKLCIDVSHSRALGLRSRRVDTPLQGTIDLCAPSRLCEFFGWRWTRLSGELGGHRRRLGA